MCVVIKISGFINMKTFHDGFKIASCTMSDQTILTHLLQVNTNHKILLLNGVEETPLFPVHSRKCDIVC